MRTAKISNARGKGRTSRHVFLSTNEVEAEAMAIERRLFYSAVPGLVARGDVRTPPLPYRRVLTAAESSPRQELLQQRWGLVGRLWFPMLAAPTGPRGTARSRVSGSGWPPDWRWRRRLI